MLDLNPHTYALENADEIDSPALLVYEERLNENLRRMVVQAGDPERLCPHVKTHKLPQVIVRQIELGVHKFKAATIAEAEMCAAAGAPQVLLAHAPVGPRAERLVALVRAFPNTSFAAIVDDADVARHLSGVVSRAGASLDVLLDIDCGMHRSGIAPGSDAEELYRLVCTLPGLRAVGLHAYDGPAFTIPRSPLSRCARIADEALSPARALRERSACRGLARSLRLATGGTPTFPVARGARGCRVQPRHLGAVGLRVRHDAAGLGLFVRGRAAHARDQPSAAEPPVFGLGTQGRWLGDAAAARFGARSRRRQGRRPQRRAPGARNRTRRRVPARQRAVRGLPWHICPTVNLHSEVVLVQNRRATTRWPVVARSRFSHHGLSAF